MVDKGDASYIFSRIAEPFRGYAQHIWKDLNFGLCRSKVDFEKLKSSGANKHDLADQFTIALPYAGSQLKWEIIFDSLYPWFAPDFRFDDDTFLADVNDDFIEQHIPSLANWNDNDPKALSCVIAELMNLYREHQKKLLCEDENSRAHFEYTALIGDCLTLENDVEILVGRGDTVSFMIKLNVDFSPLPGLYTDHSNENPGGECAVILVRYPNPTAAKLILSPFMAQVIGEITLPLMDRAGVLMDYVPMVTQLLDKKIKICAELPKRLANLTVKFENCILEFDSRQASFLFNVDDFYCIAKINTVTSVNGELLLLLIPVNPLLCSFKWIQHSALLINIEGFIFEQITLFKEDCEARLPELQNQDIYHSDGSRKKGKLKLKNKKV